MNKSAQLLPTIYRSLLRLGRALDRAPLSKALLIAQPACLFDRRSRALVQLPKLSGWSSALESFNGGEFYGPESSAQAAIRLAFAERPQGDPVDMGLTAMRSLGFAARSDCYSLIRLLLARAEVGCTLHDASSGGVGNTPLAHLIRWKVLVQRTLAWVLFIVGEPPAGGDGPALRDFCAAVMASAYFRLPHFGYALLTALQSEDVLHADIPEFRALTFTLDCADEPPMFAHRGFSELPPLDWRALHQRVAVPTSEWEQVS